MPTNTQPSSTSPRELAGSIHSAGSAEQQQPAGVTVTPGHRCSPALVKLGLKQRHQLAHFWGDVSPRPKFYPEISDEASLKMFDKRLRVLASFNAAHAPLALFQIKCLTELENNKEAQLAKQPEITTLQ